MSSDAVELAVRYARRLPASSIRRMARAAEDGIDGLVKLRAQASSEILRRACSDLIGQVQAGVAPAFISGALLTSVHDQQSGRMRGMSEAVWTGPDIGPTTRLTLAVVADLIASATSEILLASYATYPSAEVASALHRAASNGIDITLLLERHADNPSFTGLANPFRGLAARFLSWPSEIRPSGASMHMKLLAIDRQMALVGSANLTSKALEANLELGVLVRDPSTVAGLVSHINQLAAAGHLIEASA